MHKNCEWESPLQTLKNGGTGLLSTAVSSMFPRQFFFFKYCAGNENNRAAYVQPPAPLPLLPLLIFPCFVVPLVQERGLKLSGRKAELIQRLQEPLERTLTASPSSLLSSSTPSTSPPSPSSVSSSPKLSRKSPRKSAASPHTRTKAAAPDSAASLAAAAAHINLPGTGEDLFVAKDDMDADVVDLRNDSAWNQEDW